MVKSREAKRRARLRRTINEAITNARDYARSGRIDMTQIWLDNAARRGPITEMQLWGLKQILGWDFDKLKTDHIQVIPTRELRTAL